MGQPPGAPDDWAQKGAHILLDSASIVEMRPLSPEKKTSTQIQVRLAPEDIEKLERLVEDANAQAVEMGLPPGVTLSSLVRHWVQQRLGTFEHREPTRQLRAAPHLTKASEVLKGARKP